MRNPNRLSACTFYGVIVAGGLIGLVLPFASIELADPDFDMAWLGSVCSLLFSIPLGMTAGLVCAITLDWVSRRD